MNQQAGLAQGNTICPVAVIWQLPNSQYHQQIGLNQGSNLSPVTALSLIDQLQFLPNTNRATNLRVDGSLKIIPESNANTIDNNPKPE